MEPPRTAIVGVAAALDQAGLLQPVDDPAQGDRLDIEVIGELDLAQARRARDPRQRPPLRAGHAQRRDPAIERAAQRMRGFGDFERKRIGVHNVTYNKYAY